MEAAAERAAEEAKRRAPVVTGELRDSIVLEERGDDEWAVVAGAPYAGHVEYGTVYAPAQSFLRPAIRVASDEVAGEVKSRLRKWN